MFGIDLKTPAIAALLLSCSITLVHAQSSRNAGNTPRADTNKAAAAQPKITRELWQLLTDWAEASANVKQLHGKHVRRAYDDTFRIEKISQGEFWYENPDRGRIDVLPVKITKKMLADREDSKAQVKRGSDGKPYELKSDLPERWICDGEKVYDIDDRQKEARIVVLPPDIRGENIMNSPLPFLFGMPPDKAVKRFTMRILKDYRPKYDVVFLEAVPRMSKDAQNWSSARIYLNTETWLPSSVLLINPAKTKSTSYTFRNMEVNKQGLIQTMLGGNPFDPKLGRDFKIHVINPGDQQSVAETPKVPLVPNVVGKAHDVATNILLDAGIKRENIKKLNAGPAPRQNLIYLVSSQQPRGGTPLKSGEMIQLMIFDNPAKAAKKGNGNAARARNENERVVARPRN